MIEGIEVLAQNDVMEPMRWIIIVCTSFFVLAILGFILFVVGAVLCNSLLDIGGWIMCIGMIFAFVSGLFTDIFEESTGRYEYQVIIGENVSFTDVYSNYEVVDQNGLIWTIRDKEVGD